MITQPERIDLIRALKAITGIRDRRLRARVYGGTLAEVLQDAEESLRVLTDMEVSTVKDRSEAA